MSSTSEQRPLGSRFQLVGLDELGAETPGWGPWQSTLGSSQADADAEQPDATPLRWQIDLPAEPELAERTIRQELASSADRSAKAETALPRLLTLLRTQQSSPGGESSVSFALGPRVLAPATASGSVALAPPERELWASLQHDGASAALSFGAGLKAAEGASETELQRTLIAPLQRILRYAMVETRVEERLLGVTSVTLTGDFASCLAGDATRQERGLHQRSVGLVLQSRRAWVESLVLAARCALVLANATAHPLGLARLVILAGKYVRSVVAEAKSPS